MNIIRVFIAAPLFMVFLLGPVQAESVKRQGGGSTAALKVQMMLQQVALERDALKSENAQLQAEVEKLKKKLESQSDRQKNLKNRLGKSGEVITKYKERTDLLTDKIKEYNEKMRKLVAKFREVVASLQHVESERAALQNKVAFQEKDMKQCAEKNFKLYELNMDIVKRYENKGVWQAFTQAEPLTGLKQVEIENIVEEYRDKFENLQVSETLANNRQQAGR